MSQSPLCSPPRVVSLLLAHHPQVNDSSGFGTGGPVLKLQSFHHPTPVVLIPLRASKFPGCLASIRRTVSHNVNRFGCVGIKKPSTGAFSVRPRSASTITLIDGFLHLLAYSTVKFYGVIPWGESFNIPQGPLSTTIGAGTGFNRTVDITVGTNFHVVGGDDRGIGSGGFEGYTVDYSSNNSCLNSASPSSTPGIPVGSNFPTSTSGSPSTSNPASTSGLPSGRSKGHS